MCRNSEIPMQVPTKLLCFFQTNFEICKTHFCPSSPSFSVGMDKFLTLNFIFLPIARWMFNLWLCIIQKHLMKIWYVVLHRTHLNNANKLLVFSLPFPVEFQQCQWVRHRTDVGGTVLHSKIVRLTGLWSPQRNSIRFLLFPSEVLTPMTSVQIKYGCCQIIGHTGSSGGRGMVY